MWKKLLSLLLGSAMALPSGSALASQRADAAWELIESGALIVDVRTPEEFAQGHLDDAINIPLDTVETGFADIAKDRSIVVYCRSGNRSGIAMQSLVKQGFINVHNGGGLSEMQEAQLNLAPLN
ncbi:rhodanese-like domain-containing protein [Vibrio ziniensis]|uniref:Rhodanese-like domain-containing protein n=1 Tax=Vibrio ziniensis TaxID=2711221 RepID=A0A6G7CP01_9VIBR|nr:rhodanese-like domain-containing protein [Vibrio ziniensis]